MNKTYFNSILAGLVICLAYSCANIQEENVVTPESIEEEQSLEVFDYKAGEDSLKVRSIMQSDIDMILLNHISLIDGTYTFVLSKEDALSLGADEDKYLYYKAMAERLNER